VISSLAVDRGIIQCLRDEKHNRTPVGFRPRAAGKIHKVGIARLTHELQTSKAWRRLNGLHKVSKESGRSAAQMAINCFVQKPAVTAPSLKLICKTSFEHHAAMNASHTAKILNEAFTTYFRWDTYMHSAS
jgi:hypothetical protein